MSYDLATAIRNEIEKMSHEMTPGFLNRTRARRGPCTMHDTGLALNCTIVHRRQRRIVPAVKR